MRRELYECSLRGITAGSKGDIYRLDFVTNMKEVNLMMKNLVKKSSIVSTILIVLIAILLLSLGNKPKIVSAATGETTCSNPVIWADIPDVDVIRVGNYFYMSSTSMHMMPGVPIMRSTDLVNWEIVSYVYDILENNSAHNLTNGTGIYGKGSWASSLRYHNGTYYVCFASNDMGQTYIYRTADIINGPWTRSVLSGVYHDPSLLFDDDGSVYIVYGSGAVYIKQLTSDATAIKSGGLSQKLYTSPDSNLFEGSHIYKINGMYYIFNIRWTSRRIESCYRSSSLTGTWEGKIVLNSTLSGASGGVAQGGIFSTADGTWYAMLFQDHGAVGRAPVLVPVTWTNNWPIMGVNGAAPVTMTIPLSTSSIKTALLTSDDFNETKLGLNWQWNHNPDNNNWSLSARPGYLRLTTGSIASNIFLARNTLSQRTVGPTCSGEVAIETTNMKSGDYAGLTAFQDAYGIIGVKKTDSGKYLIMATNGGSGTPSEVASKALSQDKVYLKMSFNFLNCADKATFYYSLDGSTWTQFGSELSMVYKLTHFMGYRIGLFNYATKSTGGYVDFDYLHTSPTSTTSTPTPTPTVTVTPTPTPTDTTGCSISYSQSDWGSGATVSITIKNNGSSAINGWTLAWNFAGNQTITDLWNGTYTQSGTAVTVKNVSHNNIIPAKGSVSLGFNITYSGTNVKPTSFTLNGTACQLE
jgi:xylan 1,4-beta-xylosidase